MTSQWHLFLHSSVTQCRNSNVQCLFRMNRMAGAIGVTQCHILVYSIVTFQCHLMLHQDISDNSSQHFRYTLNRTTRKGQTFWLCDFEFFVSSIGIGQIVIITNLFMSIIFQKKLRQNMQFRKYQLEIKPFSFNQIY